MSRPVQLFLLLSISGCSTYVQEPPSWDAAYRDQIHVVVQVCVPANADQKLLSINSVASYGTDGKQRSYGGMATPLIAFTTAGQPVFERMLDRKIDVKAIVVRLDDHLIFSIDDRKLSDEWSTWDVPYSQNSVDDMSWYKLVYGQKIVRHSPVSDAPKARYRLTKVSEYKYPADRKRAGVVEKIPPC